MQQSPLELTPEQVEFIKPLLDLEYSGGLAKLLLGHVRRKPWSVEDPRENIYQLEFCIVSHDVGLKVLDVIDGSEKTRYAPSGKTKKEIKKSLPDLV